VSNVNPIEEIKNRIHVSPYYEEGIDDLVSLIGVDRVLYGSDYPHTIGDPIGCLARVDRLPDGVRNRVRSGNAARIFEFR